MIVPLSQVAFFYMMNGRLNTVAKAEALSLKKRVRVQASLPDEVSVLEAKHSDLIPGSEVSAVVKCLCLPAESSDQTHCAFHV